MNCAKLQAIKVDFLTIFRTHIRVLRYLKVTDRNPFWLFKQISKKDILVTFNELLFIYILYISIEGIISKKKRNGSIKLNIDRQKTFKNPHTADSNEISFLFQISVSKKHQICIVFKVLLIVIF